MKLELVLIAAISCNPAQAQSSPHLTISSPLEYQVFRRNTRLRGARQCTRRHQRRGTRRRRVHRRPFAWPMAAPGTRSSQNEFSGQIPVVAGGFYRVEIKAINSVGQPTLVTVPNVGVGEVFVISGQSDSTNHGEVPQKDANRNGHQLKWNPMVTRRRSSTRHPGQQPEGQFHSAFRRCALPQIPRPIGIASVGHGSTSVRQWLPADTPIHVMPTMTRFVRTNTDGTLVSDGTLFASMMLRIHQLGAQGFRALLWHQGESDSHQPPEHDIDADTYRTMMVTLIHASRKEAGWNFPWFVAQTTYHTPNDPSCPPIRDAQRSLWQSDLALEGPDTDTLTAPYRQNGGKGTHFNDAGLKAHGLLWADAVSRYLDNVLR